jgi:mono/diheme cytochrome c family protein
MKSVQAIIFAIYFALSATLLLAAAGDGLWVSKVPEKDRARHNPFESNPSAQAAGAKLFKQNCASCHGDDASGKDRHPSLLSERVHNATPGELQWLLTNGSMKNGMPSWSRLPEQQRWQIITYLKSLQPSETETRMSAGK